jgi:hypothetical protein
MCRFPLFAATLWAALAVHAGEPDPLAAEALRYGVAEPVVRVPPIEIPGGATVPRPTVSPPQIDIPRPAILSSCDTAGCWDSAGRRLNNQGPLLLGPRGPCLQQGAVVTCP